VDGLSGRKKNLGNEMTGAHGALPFFIDYMKDFLKDKPKEDFPKAPSMPEDMREMFKQRQRELALERAQMQPEASPSPGDENTPPSAITTPKLEDTTLPPAPRGDQPEPRTEVHRSRRRQWLLLHTRRLVRVKLNQQRRRARRATMGRRTKRDSWYFLRPFLRNPGHGFFFNLPLAIVFTE
jgi:penicillin-binding protein 1A